MTIEDIILDHDRRGISELRPHVPARFCDEAAALVLEHPGTAFVATGFYILAAKAAETDGPPGAVVIGNALEALGYRVVYVTDRYGAGLMSAIKSPNSQVVEFPIADNGTSKRTAVELLDQLSPSVLISIERCGFTEEGKYRNMHGQDISEYNAKIDHLFAEHPHTVGIGDGGNEIGMGNVASAIPTVATLVKLPCVTRTSRLVLSSVSNWGGYGLVASLSKLKGTNLLPTIEEDRDLIRRTVDAGAVDGMSTRQEYKVDGFTLEENSATLQRLHDVLA